MDIVLYIILGASFVALVSAVIAILHTRDVAQNIHQDKINDAQRKEVRSQALGGVCASCQFATLRDAVRNDKNEIVYATGWCRLGKFYKLSPWRWYKKEEDCRDSCQSWEAYPTTDETDG